MSNKLVKVLDVLKIINDKLESFKKDKINDCASFDQFIILACFVNEIPSYMDKKEIANRIRFLWQYTRNNDGTCFVGQIQKDIKELIKNIVEDLKREKIMNEIDKINDTWKKKLCNIVNTCSPNLGEFILLHEEIKTYREKFYDDCFYNKNCEVPTIENEKDYYETLQFLKNRLNKMSLSKTDIQIFNKLKNMKTEFENIPNNSYLYIRQKWDDIEL